MNNEKENMENFNSKFELIKPLITDVINEYANRTEDQELPIIEFNLLKLSLYCCPTYIIMTEAFHENKDYLDKLDNEIFKLGKELYPKRFFNFACLSDEEYKILQDEYGEDYFEKLMDM